MRLCLPLFALLVLSCDDSTSSLIPDGAPPPEAGADLPTVDGPVMVDAALPDAAVPDLPAPDQPPTPDLPIVPDIGQDTVGWDILTTAGKDYVISRLILPDATNASTLGVDLDGDGVVDNALGALLGAINSLGTGVDMQDTLDESVYSGALLQLLRLYSQDLVTNPATALQTWVGQPQTCCTLPATTTACWNQAVQTCFSGTHAFSPDPASPQSVVMAGSIAAGAMSFTASQMSLPIPLGTAGTVSVTIKAAHVKGQLSSSGISQGIVAGAIPDYEIQAKIIPALTQQLDAAIKDPLMDPTVKATISALFDTNADGTITTTEVANSTIIKTFLAGDVDVDSDGVKELSLGLGFTAVNATISP